MKSLKIFILIFAGMLMVGGCGNPAVSEAVAIETNTVTMLERVKVYVPSDWKQVKETLGSMHVKIYQVPYVGVDESKKNGGTVLLKCQGCDERLTVELFGKFTLRNSDFSEGSGNILIEADSVGDSWRRMKWQGSGAGGSFTIWDIVGVEGEVAMHFRATCPKADGMEQMEKVIDREMDVLFDSVVIGERAQEQK